MKQSVHALRRTHQRFVLRAAALREVEVDDRIGVARPAAATQICREADHIEQTASEVRG